MLFGESGFSESGGHRGDWWLLSRSRSRVL